MPTTTIGERIDALDWRALEHMLHERGYGHSAGVLRPAECAALVALYPDDRHFRSRVDMARHGFGVGDYAYFAEPLPALVAELRRALYVHLAPIANGMMTAMSEQVRYPRTLAAYRQRCHAAGQCKPTPLLLHYAAGGYNCLHRDLYGALRFPLQAAVALSRRDVDYRGGAFLLVENRPRQQARGDSIDLDQGDLVLFPVAERPMRGKRGILRGSMRHGVSRVSAGERYTLGIIFHDAE